MNPSAYHEAGHVVVARLIGRRIQQVTIEPDREYPAKTELDDTREPPHGTAEWVQWNEDELMLKCAGAVAEGKFLGPGHSAKAMLLANPDDDPYSIAGLRYPNEPARSDYLDRILERTRKCIEDNWEDVQAIAAALMQRGRLDAAAINSVLQQGTEGKRCPPTGP